MRLISRIKVMLSLLATRPVAEFSALSGHRPRFARLVVMLSDLGDGSASVGRPEGKAAGTGWGISVTTHAVRLARKEGPLPLLPAERMRQRIRAGAARPGPLLQAPGGLAVLVLGGVYRRLFVVQERTAEQAEGVAQI